MIQYLRKSSKGQSLKVLLRDDPYLIINIFFAGVILLIIAYSGFFSPDKNNYPVICLHEKLTGEPCFSCGLSHSFSLIVRGRIDEAYQWNIYGMRVFIFFVSQLILRVVFSIFYLRYPETRKQLIVIDCIGSGLIFLISFWPFIASIISGFIS
ncbi:MAG TPA: DUF2752 domain-containing protein [Bacteroidales bacterium]